MLSWILVHLQDICTIFAAVVGCATTVVKVTGNTKANSVMDKVVKVLDYVSLAQTGNNKDILTKKKK